MSINDRILEEADQVVGLNADPKDGESREHYLNLIAPGETEAMQKSMLEMSGCGLTVAGLWRNAGIKHYKLDPPYIIGTGVSRLVTLAHKVPEAWVNFAEDKLPSLGDMVLVGDNGAGGVEHVYTVTAISSDAELVLESVDGGQRTDRRNPQTGKGFQLILAKKRVWRKGRDLVFSGTDPGANIMGGRKIYGWVDVSKLEALVT